MNDRKDDGPIPSPADLPPTRPEREEPADFPHQKDPHDRDAPDVEATRVLPNPAVAGLGTVVAGPTGLPTTLPGLVLEEKEGFASSDDTEPEWHYRPNDPTKADFSADDRAETNEEQA